MDWRPPGVDDTHQRALVAAVDAVLSAVDAHAGAGSGAAGSGAAGSGAAGSRATAEPPVTGEVTALDTLCVSFGLTPFERDVLVLAAAMELDPTAAARYAAASGNPHRDYPTFSLALACLANPHWSALTPVAPLRRWRLLELEPGGGLTTGRLRIDERVLHYLAGLPYLDPRIHGLAAKIPPTDDLPRSHRDTAAALAAAWSAIDEPPHVELVGTDQQTRREVAATAADGFGATLYSMRAGDLPADPVEREALARLWEREALLIPAVLLIEAGDSKPAEPFVRTLDVPVVLSADDPQHLGHPGHRNRQRIVVTRPDPDEQRALWTTALNGSGTGMSELQLRDLVAQFSLPAHVIRAAGATIRRDAKASGSDGAELAWRAGLTQARIALDDLGHRIEPRATWDDLVLPDAQRTVLKEIVAHVRQRGRVYQQWGFESVLRRGLGVTALFAGGSGTGKTLAAEVLAGELGLDLFVIDLSQVISKYIGETEKNLRRVFDAAESGGALLLFDEADALFGKRSEIKDSHDRYANIEVSYLLMRMESYRGLAILTTNLKKALDPAFLRRIRFVLDFPFPGVPERAEIWRRVIPAATPTDGIDVQRLAQLTVPGGSIRNVALSAAFLAAEEGTPLAMRHVLAAARSEYLKLERSLTPSEVAGWV
jgi:ATPase family associated with various cellular activities (AAA)